MGMNLVPFDSQSNLPAYLSDPAAMPDINKDVVRARAFPTMSIKGKVFTINKDGVRKLITKPDDPDEVAQSIGVVILRANMSNKNFYLKGYVEGDTSPPDCHSHDGVAPSANAPSPQSKKCQICPHNQWGARIADDGTERKGRACSDNARLAIAAPDKLSEPMLLRVPPASLKHLREAVKIINQRKIPYNAVVMKISFVAEEASPMLKFKPVGLLPDADYGAAKELYDGELVRAIVGLDESGFEPAAEAPPPVTADELDAAIAARDATAKAQATPPAETPATTVRKSTKVKPATQEEVAQAVTPAPTAAPVVAQAPAPTQAPQAQAPSSAAGSLLSDLDALLGNTDD
jgi:hypothetical protein